MKKLKRKYTGEKEANTQYVFYRELDGDYIEDQVSNLVSIVSVLCDILLQADLMSQTRLDSILEHRYEIVKDKD